MKKFSLLILLCAVTFIAEAKPLKKSNKEYSKTFEENFKVSANATLDLESDFSTIDISNWDQNEILVEIEISVDSKNESSAQNFLDKANISISKSGNTVKVQTDFESNHNWKPNSFEIHIDIKAPKDCNLALDHSFGGLTLGSFGGVCDIESEYGSLDAKTLSNAKNKVEIAFGSASIESFGGGFLEVEYGSAMIEVLTGECEFENAFSELEIKKITTNSGEIQIENSYGSCEIGISGSQSFTFETDSSFGEVDLPDEVEITKKDSDSFSSSKEGKKGNGGIHFKINNSFGGVEIDYED